MLSTVHSRCHAVDQALEKEGRLFPGRDQSSRANAASVSGDAAYLRNCDTRGKSLVVAEDPPAARCSEGVWSDAERIEIFASGALVCSGHEALPSCVDGGASATVMIWWDIASSHDIWALGGTPRLRGVVEMARHGMRIRGATAETLRCHLRELVAATGFARVAAFFQVLAVLGAATPSELEPLPKAVSLDRGRDARSEAIACAIRCIYSRYRDEIRLSELLKLTRMSRACFCRQFHRHTGKSVSGFLNHVRLEAVCRELRDTNELVGNIAFNHGFNQLSFFNRLFRREMGISPSRYRARHRAQVFEREWRSALAG